MSELSKLTKLFNQNKISRRRFNRSLPFLGRFIKEEKKIKWEDKELKKQ